MAGWVLVVAILILGGVIATVGDRIGTRVGKARLSLFNLRPRKTAVLISILTGSLISGTTLALLFGLSSQLRKGVFEYAETREKLRQVNKQLNRTKDERQQFEQQRDAAQQQQQQARRTLGVIESQLKTAQAKQSSTQAELDRVASRADRLRREAEQLLTQQRTLVLQRDQVLAQINQRNAEIAAKSQIIRSRETEIARQDSDLSRQSFELNQRNRLLDDRNRLLGDRNRLLSQRDRQLQDQRQIVQAGESKLKALVDQKEILDRAIADQEEQLQRVRQGLAYYREGLDNVRQGSIVLSRSEVISTRVVRVAQSDLVRVAIDQVLREANDQALTILQLRDRTRQVIQADPLAVARLGQDLSDGREYVVRVISAKNYLLNEQGVQVILDATPNVTIFPKGAAIATTAIQLNSSREQSQQGVTLLIESARYRVGRAGVLGDNFSIGDGRFKSFVAFVEKVQDSQQPLTLQAIARDTIQTAGPTRIDLVALVDGKPLFGTTDDL
jgi:uncharacterized protein (DUF3084 family)